jgi:hypothetical protein
MGHDVSKSATVSETADDEDAKTTQGVDESDDETTREKWLALEAGIEQRSRKGNERESTARGDAEPSADADFNTLGFDASERAEPYDNMRSEEMQAPNTAIKSIKAGTDNGPPEMIGSDDPSTKGKGKGHASPRVSERLRRQQRFTHESLKRQYCIRMANKYHSRRRR